MNRIKNAEDDLVLTARLIDEGRLPKEAMRLPLFGHKRDEFEESRYACSGCSEIRSVPFECCADVYQYSIYNALWNCKFCGHKWTGAQNAGFFCHKCGRHYQSDRPGPAYASPMVMP